MDDLRILSALAWLTRLSLVVGLALAAISDAAVARSQRRAAQKPPPNVEYEPAEAQCAPAYDAALKGLFARAAPQPMSTVKLMRTPMPGLSGRWIFHTTGDRRRQRDEQGRLVDGDHICVDEHSRGGRTRCVRWEKRPVSAEPVVPVPQPTREEARVIGALAEMVANKGAPPEFLSNGRYTVLTERVAADLEGYALQEPHPAICSGAPELLDFLLEKLAPLRKRATTVEDLRDRALAAIIPRVAAIQGALAPSPGLGAAPQGTPTGEGAAEASPAVMADASQPRGEPVVAVTEAGPKKRPATPAGWLAEVAGLVLTPADAQAVAAEPTPLDGLRRMASLLAEGRSTATPVARAEARAALRGIEAAVYVDLLARRYHDLDVALFGTLEDVRKAHAAHCTCGG